MAPDTLTDPVAWAGHYWDQQGLEGDDRRFLAMSSLLRLERLVVDTVESELKKQGLNLTDYLLLMTLLLSENGTRLISSLARSLLVHATTATLATDRLEAREMLFRSPHPTDRRATCVTVTPLGTSTARGATRALSEIDFGLAGTTPADLDDFVASLSQIRQAVGDTRRK
jgi:DNA-binding MarR family transcriptional regulator